MGRFTLPFCQKVVGLLLIFLCFELNAKELAGVKLSPRLSCGGKELPLIGAGLRTATLFKIKVYVLALYGESPVSTGSLSELEKRPMCFDLTYLRDFDNADVDRAWEFQFNESSSHHYPDFKQHLKLLLEFFGKIAGSRTQRLELLPGITRIYENGDLKGEIPGADFQKSFLSIWFGAKPPTEELKQSLLKGEHRS